MTTTVRIAGPEDEAGIVRLCTEAHAENPVHKLNVLRALQTIRKGLYRQGGIVGVIGPADDIQAMIVLTLEQIWYSDEWHVIELINFVRLDCRRSTYAKDLISFAKKCADQLGVDLTIGVFTSVRTEAKIRLYERQLPKAGAFFCYRPASCGDAVTAA